MALASVVIPAHDEARGIGRTLAALREGLAGHDLDIVVVCNGCTDSTARAARVAEPRARVLEIPEPSKAAAVRVGNAATDVFPRVHLDADVVLTGASVLALVAALDGGAVLAAGPRRVLVMDGVHPVVRWYYDVWQQLPQVRGGLFGRGVIALSREGQGRVDTLPGLMSDDLVVSDAFAESERVVVAAAEALVRPPRRVRDLVRRRVRVATGNAQADAAGVRRGTSTTGWGTLAGLVRERPALAPRLPVFLAVTVLGRVGARRAVRAGDFTTWRRDESSRAG